MTLLTTSRLAAYEGQCGSCYYCGLPLWLDDDAPAIADFLRLSARQLLALRCTAEHVLARCDGGTDAGPNIVAACYYCNKHRHSHRQDRAPSSEKYLARVRNRMAAGCWHPVQSRLATWGTTGEQAAPE